MTQQTLRQLLLVVAVVVVIFIYGAAFGAVVVRSLPTVEQVEVECAIAWEG